MRIAGVFAIVVIAIAVAFLSEWQLDAPAFASGEVAVFQAKTQRHARRQLSSKQLVELQLWLSERKSGWSPFGKIPPETVIELIDMEGHKFHIRVTNSTVMANGKFKSFPEKEIFGLKSVLGISDDK